MSRTKRLGDYLIGVGGLAIVRNLLTGAPEDVAACVGEVDKVIERAAEEPYSLQAEVDVLEVVEGYAMFAESYEEGVPLMLDEEVIGALCRDTSPGVALLAACGQGRHADGLLAAGHEVIGVDLSPEMLEHARRSFGQGTWKVGDLTSLPLEDASVDIAVCAYALTQFEDLLVPIKELARVVRPGGRLVISDVHPMLQLLGVQPLYRTGEGRMGFVLDNRYQVSDYFAAFASAGVKVRAFHEPKLSPQDAKEFYFADLMPDTFALAYGNVPACLVWDLERPAEAA